MSAQARRVDSAHTSSVTITKEEEWFVARDEETGVASQGKTRPEALANLAAAIELHEEPIPDDAELEEPDVPWFDS
jgi:predicted RNase H-like HicB family nuclease